MKKILLIEDDAIMLRVIKNVLIKDEHIVDVATNGKEAIQKLEAENYQYDLVITDLMIPYSTGYEVISKIKSQPDGHKMSIIIISSLNNEDSILQGFDLGADDYLKKPILTTELRIRVNRLLYPRVKT
jgi:DNA-binding response OmpR family regulator